MNRFNTISEPTEGLFKDRGSKFISYAFPISSVSDVKSKLELLKEKHPSSRHICYAYRVGINGIEYRANDDGEPSGSAGLPILNQIKSKDLTNTMVAVVRYFGGTKLGVSGLINAYKMAAMEALASVLIIEKVPNSVILLKFPPNNIGVVERLIRKHRLVVIKQSFGLECNWTIRCPSEDEGRTRELFQSLQDIHVF